MTSFQGWQSTYQTEVCACWKSLLSALGNTKIEIRVFKKKSLQLFDVRILNHAQTFFVLSQQLQRKGNKKNQWLVCQKDLQE